MRPDPPAAPEASTAPAAPWSLQRQLRQRLLALITVAWLAASALVGAVVWRGTGEVLDSALQETAERLLLMTAAIPGEPDTAARLAELGAHGEFVVYQVFDAQGQLRLRSHGAPDRALHPGARRGVSQFDGWRVYTLGMPDGRRAQVAETLAHRREVMWTSLGGLLLMPLALLPLVALGARWVLDRGFAALEPARRELARRGEHELSPLRLDGAPQELRPWVDAVDALLARTRAMVDSERAFAANTAHELRTPLAAAMAQAQRLQQACGDDPDTRAAAEALVRQLARLTRLSTRLLQLARIEAGVTLRREPVDLAALVLLVADDFADAQRDGRLRLAVRDIPATVRGDIDALGIALRNLIDNALKHSGPAGQVTVRLDGAEITVEDDGPGVPSERLQALRRPFARDAAVTAEGSGLGLALVEAIARQSDAQLRLQSPLRPGGGGFAATLEFQAVTTPPP
ncbi:ATP-binding protein [Ideonella sp. DXS22W]|uniref:histidine kinase n=1 Tax=Pseudaquabacterium inlustre TaxID=2984192 RepID=A0ABU9CEX9_9BURK